MPDAPEYGKLAQDDNQSRRLLTSFALNQAGASGRNPFALLDENGKAT